MSPQACTPAVQKQEITVMADYGTPMLVSNHSGLLSGAKFSVSFNNGLLTSVNAEPIQKPSELVSATMPLMTHPAPLLARPGQPRLLPACNAGPEVSDFRKATLSAE
jgi:hypothetical protein